MSRKTVSKERSNPEQGKSPPLSKHERKQISAQEVKINDLEVAYKRGGTFHDGDYDNLMEAYAELEDLYDQYGVQEKQRRKPNIV